jgi:hypothetical protein
MKRNIRNLIVIAIITVIASFIMATTVMAGQPYHRAIRGQYASTGSSTQLIAICGFPPPPDDKYIPNGAAGGAWAVQSVSMQGVWMFNPDGTGTTSSTHRVVTHRSIAPAQADLTPWAGMRTTSFSFAYTIEKDGTIIITADPATFISEWLSGPNKGQPPSHLSELILEGTISPDGKTIILNGGLPDVADITPQIIPQCPNPQLISNTSVVLIWQHR